MTMPSSTHPAGSRDALMRWDLFCRVVDNLGDAAVMWRLARQLAVEHGRQVRLFVDQPEVLRLLVPAARVGGTVEGVEICGLTTDPGETGDEERGDEQIGDAGIGNGVTAPGVTGDRPSGGVGTVAGGAPACDPDVVVAGFHAALPSSYRRCLATFATEAASTTAARTTAASRTAGSRTAAGTIPAGMTAAGPTGPGRMRRAPIWINLEYLSAEDWIEGFHRRPSPHADGLTEWFFYPGFTLASGGLLRETDLVERREAFRRDRGADGFLAGLGVHRQRGETVASLLCYPDAPLAALARRLADSSARLHLLVPQDAVAVGADDAGLVAAGRGRLRITRIPFLPQREYDSLLWSCDLNFVRGEDSLVRAVWSGKPFVWQLYPQAEAAHLPKLEAFLRLLPGGPLADATRWWNGVADAPDVSMLGLIEQPAWGEDSLKLLSHLHRTADLARRLLEFVDHLAAQPDRDSRMTGKL